MFFKVFGRSKYARREEARACRWCQEAGKNRARDWIEGGRATEGGGGRSRAGLGRGRGREAQRREHAVVVRHGHGAARELLEHHLARKHPHTLHATGWFFTLGYPLEPGLEAPMSFF